MAMRCSYCNESLCLENIEVKNLPGRDVKVYYSEKNFHTIKAYLVLWGFCSFCNNLILFVKRSFNPIPEKTPENLFKSFVREQDIVYPHKPKTRSISDQNVPEEYRKEFAKASAVLSVSPEASAALSRKLLERILEEKYNITDKFLANKIKKFKQMSDIPAHILEAVDAVREIGNFAAHPLKDAQSNAIIEVEPEEADFNLDVLEALLEFAYTQKMKRDQIIKKLNTKLKSAGKKPLNP
jgi:hypothetical protein